MLDLPSILWTITSASQLLTNENVYLYIDKNLLKTNILKIDGGRSRWSEKNLSL